jgi:hypothetical protein
MPLAFDGHIQGATQWEVGAEDCAPSGAVTGRPAFSDAIHSGD